MKRPSATVLPRSKHTSPRCMWSHWRPGCNGSRATGGAREGQLNFWCLGLSGSATYSFQDIPFISCSCLMVLHIISYHMISLNLLAELVPVLPCGACWICFNKSSCMGLFWVRSVSVWVATIVRWIPRNTRNKVKTLPNSKTTYPPLI